MAQAAHLVLRIRPSLPARLSVRQSIRPGEKRMLPEMQTRFHAIEQQRSDIQSRITRLSDEQLDWTPETTSWSIRQIIEHLVLCDETLGRAREAGSVMKEAPVFRAVPRALKRALVLRALSRGAILPVPSPAVEPQGNVSLTELVSRWETARGEMQGFLHTLAEDETRYLHPVLGPLTATQMLELNETHAGYHWRQMNALLQRNAFPHPEET
jgi:hypothetical protein